MSYHVNDSELESQLIKQRRQASVVSVLIALFTCAVLALSLTLIWLVPSYRPVPKVISYPLAAIHEVSEQKLEDTEQRLEQSPVASSLAPIEWMKAQVSAPIALPIFEPNLESYTPVVELGAENGDFGGEWVSAGEASSSGGSVQIFEQEIKANHIAYVIDYSKSLGSKKQALMKNELSKSIRNLPAGMEYSLVFFAGPAWLPGSEVTELSKTKWEVLQKGKRYIWSKEGDIYTSKPAQPRVEWLKSTRANIRTSLKQVETSGLVYGTSWYTPLEMALKMKPKPDVVFFMTDGLAAGTQRVVEDLGEFARKRKIVINTIAINEPKAREAMGRLAKMTKGEFSLVDEEGKKIAGGE